MAERDAKKRFDGPAVYRIVLHGHLGDEWSEWFEGLSITRDRHGQTILLGPVRDQATLHGLLNKIRNLGIPLVSINRLDSGPRVTTE